MNDRNKKLTRDLINRPCSPLGDDLKATEQDKFKVPIIGDDDSLKRLAETLQLRALSRLCHKDE